MKTITKNSKGYKASGELKAAQKITGGTPLKKGSELKTPGKITGGTPFKGKKS